MYAIIDIMRLSKKITDTTDTRFLDSTNTKFLDSTNTKTIVINLKGNNQFEYYFISMINPKWWKSFFWIKQPFLYVLLMFVQVTCIGHWKLTRKRDERKQLFIVFVYIYFFFRLLMVPSLNLFISFICLFIF